MFSYYNFLSDRRYPPIRSATPVDQPDSIWVTALVAIMEPATEHFSLKAPNIPLRSHPSNKTRVLLDTGSNGDIFSMKKKNPNLFST